MNETDYPDLHADGSPRDHTRHAEAGIFEQYAAIIRRLRAEDGCPWDRKQTLQSLRRFIVEEAFEVLAAINDIQDHTDAATISPAPDTAAVDPRMQYAAVADELGDVVLVSLLLADALEAESGITLEDVLIENGRKLVRRHPHVFGSADATTTDQVVANWNQIKEQQEGRSTSVAHVSSGLPPLERAFEMQKKAAKTGFDWTTVQPALEKLKEEIDELEQQIDEATTLELPTKDNPNIEEELGDLLFSAVNVSRHLKTDPSVALARTNAKFLARFQYIEDAIAARGTTLENSSLEILDQLWDEAKNQKRRS